MRGLSAACVLAVAAASPPTTLLGTVHYGGRHGEDTTIQVAPALAMVSLGGGDATIRYTPSLLADGWDRLEVKAGGTGRASAFAAGFGEGYLAQKSIYLMYQNNYADWFTDEGDKGFPPSTAFGWLRENYNWTRQTADAKAGSGDKFWSWTATMLDQLEGLAVGYNRAAPADEQLGFEAFLLLNADGDLESLTTALGPVAKRDRGPREERCSSMWKMSDDGQDIFFGHTTWDHFDEAYRALKSYTWGDEVTVKLSSSPGFLTSVDDFYITSHNLVVIETTNGNFNADLWSKVHSSSVLCWLRCGVANYAATTTSEWTKLFSTENSGTYNNQWMILDMKLFTPGVPLVDGTFVILEQLPGECAVEDKSQHLQSQRYWGSYNIPAIPSVWQKSGFGDGSPAWKHDHELCPRAVMMRKLNATDKTLDNHKALLRYNNRDMTHTDHDVAAGWGISGRFDLVPDTGFALSGGIDSKASSVSLAKDRQAFWAQNGPTHDDVPAFVWSKVTYPNSKYTDPPVHEGLPDVMAWDWVFYE